MNTIIQEILYAFIHDVNLTCWFGFLEDSEWLVVKMRIIESTQSDKNGKLKIKKYGMYIGKSAKIVTFVVKYILSNKLSGHVMVTLYFISVLY